LRDTPRDYDFELTLANVGDLQSTFGPVPLAPELAVPIELPPRRTVVVHVK